MVNSVAQCEILKYKKLQMRHMQCAHLKRKSNDFWFVLYTSIYTMNRSFF